MEESTSKSTERSLPGCVLSLIKRIDTIKHVGNKKKLVTRILLMGRFFWFGDSDSGIIEIFVLLILIV